LRRACEKRKGTSTKIKKKDEYPSLNKKRESTMNREEAQAKFKEWQKEDSRTRIIKEKNSVPVGEGSP